MTGFWLLGQKANNIQEFLFLVLILLIPTQFGRHFWPDFSFIKGVRIDYLSPTLYFTDTLILLIFIFWIFSKNKFLISNFKFQLPILLFAVCLIVGDVLSKSPVGGFFGLIKFLEFVFLGFYTARNISKFKFQNILLIFSIGIIFESFLAISQYVNHGSLQGIFYFFGERFFNSQTPGIANASLGGELFLRPYGTFSHPNVLAGYLVLAMSFIIFNLKFSIKSKFSIFNFKIFLSSIALVLGSSALFLTLSRVAIILWILILGFMFMRHFIKTKFKLSIFHILLSIFALALIIFLLTNSPFKFRFTNLSLSDESILQREKLITNSIAMIKDNPFFGVGINNFLVNLPSYQKPNASFFYLQPVHNIFVLITAETGIIGFSFFIWFLVKTYGRIKDKGLSIKRDHPFIIYNLSFILILGMFDHYFLTLQQGQLLFSLVLGICWSDPETSSG